MQGYIALHRKILESTVFQDDGLFKMWCYCLMRANHKPREVLHDGILVQLEAGQFITGRKVLASALNTTERKVRTRIVLLENMGNIVVKATKRYSVITIVNWGYYQTDRNETTNRRPTDDQQTTTDNNVNNVNNVNKKPSSSSDDVFAKFWSSYPRKVGKGAAEKAWAKVTTPLEEVLEAVEKQKLSDQWQKDSGRFIPHPATWLNQKRWEDECQFSSGNHKEVYAVFAKVLGITIPKNWDSSQQQHAENLYTERGLTSVENALLYAKANRTEKYCPIISNPKDLDTKWSKLGEFKKSQS